MPDWFWVLTEFNHLRNLRSLCWSWYLISLLKSGCNHLCTSLYSNRSACIYARGPVAAAAASAGGAAAQSVANDPKQAIEEKRKAGQFSGKKLRKRCYGVSGRVHSYIISKESIFWGLLGATCVWIFLTILIILIIRARMMWHFCLEPGMPHYSLAKQKYEIALLAQIRGQFFEHQFGKFF